MAATYEKLTLDTFKKKMKAGGYKDLAGARRAIGRMSEWTEAERDKARAAAAKYFGGEPAKKVTKKTTKKRTTKGPAKVSKKRAPKKAAKKKVAMKKKTMGRARAKKTPVEAPVMDRIQQQKLRIGTIQEALNAMRTAKELGATATEVQEGAKAAQRGLTASVNELCGLTIEAATEAAGGNSGSVNQDALDRAHAAATQSGGLAAPPAMAAPPEEAG